MLRSNFCFCVLCAILGTLLLLGLLLLTGDTTSAQTPAPAKESVSFINDVAPILKENCFTCHVGKNAKGKLDMSRYETLRKGGTREDPIVPGEPDDSLLLQLITATDTTRMPPPDNGEPLAPAKIAVIKNWIKQGARLDKEVAANAELYRELRIRRKPPMPATTYRAAQPVTALAFTPDKKRLVVGGHHELTVWDVATAKLEKRIYTRAERARDLRFLPDGKLIVAGGWPGQEGDVKVYDLQGGKPVVFEGQGPGNATVLDGVNDKTVMVKQLLECDDEILCLAISADGKKLAAGGCDRIAHVWDLSAGYAEAKKEQAIENHADWLMGMAFTSDGKRLITASRDKTVKGWNLGTKDPAFTMPDHQAAVNGLTVRANIGISVGEDRQVRFWDASGNGKQTRALPGHTDMVTRILAHPNKPLAFTCSHDGTIRTWNADTGSALRTLGRHSDYIFALAISDDGELLASGSRSGEIKVWKVADGSLVKEFNGSPGFKPAVALPAGSR